MTSTTKKVVAGVTAAATIATGVFVATYDNAKQIDLDKLVPDINSYMPSMPNLDLNVGLNIPDLNTNLLDFNTNLEFNTNFEISKLNIETVKPYVSVGNIDLSKINIETVQSDIVATNIDLFDKSEITIENVVIEGNTLKFITFNLPEFNFSLKMPVLDKEYNYDELIERQKKILSLFKDRRNIEHDENILFNKHIVEWIKIYDNYKIKSFSKIPLQKDFRMISEVKLPKTNKQFETLERNLAYYKSRGYDSVLIVFDGSENPSDLNKLVKYIRYKGFRSFFAFGGEENLYVSVFIDPETLKKQLQSLAQYSEGFLLGWRRTSAHLLEQDIQYMNYMSECVRIVNKNCLIFGEIYYGNTAKYPHEGKWGFGYNLPNYASGVVVCNFGYESVNAEGVVKYVVPSKIGNKYQQIAVITGQRPYYLTEYKNNLSQEENQKIKENLELRFKKAGCKGTITLHDDGKNGIGGYHINNNLSETIYTSLK